MREGGREGGRSEGGREGREERWWVEWKACVIEVKIHEGFVSPNVKHLKFNLNAIIISAKLFTVAV